jgi:lauroyl/myristoyl acyltransferase
VNAISILIIFIEKDITALIKHFNTQASTLTNSAQLLRHVAKQITMFCLIQEQDSHRFHSGSWPDKNAL